MEVQVKQAGFEGDGAVSATAGTGFTVGLDAGRVVEQAELGEADRVAAACISRAADDGSTFFEAAFMLGKLPAVAASDSVRRVTTWLPGA